MRPFARSSGVQCFERSDGTPGKGAAIAWAIDGLRTRNTDYDALVIVDADTVVDAHLLDAYDVALRNGHEIQQGYNYLSNPGETPFARIIAVTSGSATRSSTAGRNGWASRRC